MKMIRAIITAFLCGTFHLSAQEAKENWILQNSETGNKTYVARDAITLKPGFTYTASSGNSFHAKIDPALLFPPAENTYALPDGSITSDPGAGAVVGNLSGSFDISPSGAATYSVPITCPPGIQGMQPNISLTYNSQSGSGIAGMCWNLGGLSMISRVPKNYYYDNDRSGIIWDNTSPLALDGQRLIKIQEWGTDSVEYRTENGLDKIIGYNILSWGPLTFKVYAKNGNILEYGNEFSVDSYYPLRLMRNMTVISYSNFRNLGWMLVKITDANNNYVKFNYVSDISATHMLYNSTRISTVVYGSETNATEEIAGKLIFQYKNKSVAPIQYIDSYTLKTQYILDKIEVKGLNDKLHETYQLDYNTVDSTDFLTQIKKINASGEFIHPLAFEWSPMSTYNYTRTSDVSFEITPTLTNLDGNFYPAAFGDFDGDNLIDVIIRYRKGDNTNATWIAYKNRGDNWYLYRGEFSWNYEYEKTFFFLDSDGDGKDELYVGRTRVDNYGYGYHLDCYRYQDNMLQAYTEGNKRIPINGSIYNDNDVKKQLHVISGDFSGEGNPQFILFKKDNKMVSQLGLSGLNLNAFGGDASSKIFLSDINANGQTEIAYRNNGTTTFYEYRKSSGFVSIYSTPEIAQNDDVYTEDFNGDGNTDIMTKKGYYPYNWRCFVSTGSDLIEKGISSFISSSVSGIHILDVNQDGKSDILLTSPNNSSGTSYTLKLLISDGSSFITKILDSSCNSVYKDQNALGNIQSGHSKDLFLYGFYGILFGSPYYVEHPEIISLNKNIWFNKIIKITDSFDHILTVGYKDYKNPYHTKTSQLTNNDNYPGKNLSTNLYSDFEVVNDVHATSINTSFTFTSPYVHKQGRGFLGFSTIQTRDNTRSLITSVENKLDLTFYFLYPYKNTIKTAGGTVISENTANYTTFNEGSKKYFLRQDSQVSTDALKGITTTTSFSNYDSYRNPQTVTTNYGNGITETASISYIQRGSRYPDKIASKTVTQSSPGESNTVRTQHYTYDSKGNILTHTVDSLNTNRMLTVYSDYDPYGNPGKITVTANGISRSTAMTYCSYDRFLKTETDRQFNETITYSYNESHGLLTSRTDPAGTTNYQYDNFGRLKLTTYPDNTKTATTLQWAENIAGKPVNAKYYNYSETSGQSPVITWYDPLSREIRQDAYGLNNQKTSVDIEYSSGRLYRISEPYFTNNPNNKIWAATHRYDTYGRKSSVSTPLGTTNYTYNGLTTKTTSPSDVVETTINSAGQTLSQKTNGKTVTFTYYSSGLPKTATPEGGSTVSMEYDLQGNRTKLTDPDAGIVESQYNGFGELLWERQKVHSTNSYVTATYSYAQTGLLNSIVRQGNTTETTVYSYDGDSGRPRRIKSIEIPGQHKQSFSYDAYDRIINMKEEFDGKIFNQSTTYDVFGRIKRETYPSGYYTDNSYDKYSNITAIKDRSGRLIWQPLEENARGQVISEKRGNRETAYTYYDTGRQRLVQASGITDNSYMFDVKGNLIYRDNYITADHPKETFSYDNMNRLTSGSISRQETVSMSYSLNYDAQGNIQAKSDLGSPTMNYGANGKPHALTSISDIPANFPSNSLSVTYTDFKKIKTLTEGNKSYQITYGVDDQRRKSVYSVNSSTQMTRYYLGNYEEELTPNGNTRKIHYLKDAVYIQNTSGGDSLLFIYTDYLGSLTTLTDYDGNVVEHYSYDPWGRRRNPSNWSLYDTRTSFILNRGYTGHEHLDAFGIINMNGRVYDPLTASFFSPDPYIQAPGNWLNYNRYSYCLNNPLIYTDPTGEFWHIVIGAVIGGVVNLVANWNNCDGFWQYVTAFTVGAGAGAATVATGGAGASTWAVVGVGAGTGAVTAGTNNVISQTGHNFSGMNNVDWGQVGVNSAVGLVSGAASAGVGYAASNMNFLVNGVSSPVLRSAVASPLASGAGHIAGGTTANLFAGQNFGDAFANSFKGLGENMAIGGAIGVSATIGVSYANGINPITGRMMWPKNSGFQGNPEYTTLKKGTMLDRYGDDTGQFVAPQGTPFDQRALPPNYVNKSLSIYEVTQPLPVLQGATAPSFWFNSGGGGTQYMLPIQYYLNNGYLIKVR